MSDPVVCSFITKVLCSKGGRLGFQELFQEVQLPEQQVRQILEDVGQERFVIQKEGSSTWVLAVSSVRVCVRKECFSGCSRLHLCKLYLMGKCRTRICKYSHDIFSEDNQKVLKNHQLSGLNEDDLRILLLQNDPFFLPDVCQVYNKGEEKCSQRANCTKLHICRFFLKGQCRFPHCKRSHNLLDPDTLALLLAEGLDHKIAWNIQSICDHKTAAFCKELGQSKTYSSNPKPTSGGRRSDALNWTEYRLEQASSLLTSMQLEPAKAVKAVSPTEPLSTEKEKSDEICLHYVWRFCKYRNNCPLVHCDLPYCWQKYIGNDWHNIAENKEIEKAYCDPSLTCHWNPDINFCSMTSNHAPVRRLSTPSSVTKPTKFVMTTKWLWYWKNDLGQWIEYGNQSMRPQTTACGMDPAHHGHPSGLHSHLPPARALAARAGRWWLAHLEMVFDLLGDLRAHMPDAVSYMPDGISLACASRHPHFTGLRQLLQLFNWPPIEKVLRTADPEFKPGRSVQKNVQDASQEDGQHQGSSLGSDDLENLFLAEPNGTIQFEAGSQQYVINFKEMTQRNLLYNTKREVRRRPKFVSSEDVKTKKGHTAGPVPVSTAASASPLGPALNYPLEWDRSALPAIGYKAVELSKTSHEYTKIANLFQTTMSNYVIKKIKRIQNPSLWQVFQWQKEQMKKKKGGQNVEEKLLFHGTNYSFLEAICNDNFDWRICGTNGTVFGKGSYFARDAQYSHNYCQHKANSKEFVLFVAQVLVGDSAKGHSTYSRPPAKSTDPTRCYDSCVDNLMDASIYIIFEKHQIYPAYLIYYEEDKKCVLA
ncbi:Protein mono-ADP-ribosyltransferase PARP12 [Varanus komodoensis]|nr:Protein mono-ADP-ribosyltransferase PARP12 [Varanus komodoensis]